MADWWKELITSRLCKKDRSMMKDTKTVMSKNKRTLLLKNIASASPSTHKLFVKEAVTASSTTGTKSQSKRHSNIRKKKGENCAGVYNSSKRKVVSILKRNVIPDGKSIASHGEVLHCRLCDKIVTSENCQMLFDYNLNMETRLGRMVNIILNSSSRGDHIKLSNYCCSVCSSKIQLCFGLLVEIQASDEVIRQTYKHLDDRTVVNTITQSFLCEECKSTVIGIKAFIKHYENHVLKKTVTGSKKDLHITEIVHIVNHDSNESGKERENINESHNKIKNNKAFEEEVELVSGENDAPGDEVDGIEIIDDQTRDSTYEELENNEEEISVGVDESYDQLMDLDEVNVENEVNELNDLTLEKLLQEEDSDVPSESQSLNSSNSYQNLVEVVKRELEESPASDFLVDHVFEARPNEEGQYTCDVCDSQFKFKYLLLRHIKNDHVGEESQEEFLEDRSQMGHKTCRYCKESFSAIEFRKHYPVCKEDSCVDVLCHICGRNYTYKQYLSHKRKHEIFPEPGGWPCELCGKKFKAKRFLKSHLGEHDESKKKICEICGKKLLPLSLFSHMLKHKEKRHVCHLCGKGFTYNYSLQIHLKVHDGRAPNSKPGKKKEKVVCWFCKAELDNVQALGKHLKSEHNTKEGEQNTRFPCSLCDKRFADMFSLKAHLKLMHKMADEEVAKIKSLPVYRYIECDVCKTVFNSENKVKIHMKTVHGLKPFEMEALKKQCELCGKKFASKQNLLHHINGAHLGIKPLTCDVCQEKFAKHSSLIYHKLRHSGEKPFQCEYCQKTYRQRNDVIRHLARHVRDHELSLEEASAINTSPSPLVMKRRIFLKDSSINYQTVMRKSRRIKAEVVTMDIEEEQHVKYEEEVDTEEMIDEQEIIDEEEVITEEFPAESSTAVQYMTARPVYNEQRNTIILSNPGEIVRSVKGVTYRYIPSQIKDMPAVIVKKQGEL